MYSFCTSLPLFNFWEMADPIKDPDPMAMMQAFASTFMKAMNEMNARQSPAAPTTTHAIAPFMPR